MSRFLWRNSLAENGEFYATLSSDEFILFAFSYTESCRCSINVIN